MDVPEREVTGDHMEMFSGLIEDLHSGAFLHVMCEDFRNLVTWAHSHSTICSLVPSPSEGYRLEEVNTFVLPFNCTAGHAYNWPVLSLAERVRKAKSVLSWTKKRKRGLLEEEETELPEEADDLSVRAELDDSQSSLFANVSGEQGCGISGEQRDVSTPELSKANTQQKKKQKKKAKKLSLSSTGKSRNLASASGASTSGYADFPNLPQILRLAETALMQIEHFAEDFATNTSFALDDSSMHLEELESDADRTAEEELVSGGGDLEATASDEVQQSSQSEGHLSPAIPGSPVAGPSSSTSTSTPTASSSKGKKKATAASRRVKGILGSVRGDLLNFEAWRASTYASDSRPLGSLAVAELDALFASYLRYLWEASHLDLSHYMLVQQARILDCYLKQQGCFHSVQRSSELCVTHQLLEEYYESLHERESDQHGSVIHSVTAAEEEELRRMGVLGRHGPEALLNLVLYNNVRAFGPAHLYRTWPLPAGKFHTARVVPVAEPGADPDAEQPILECLEWVDPSDPEQASLRMLQNAHDPLRCPLEDFRIYAAKHPGGSLGPNDAVYSNQRATAGAGTIADPKASEWYSRAPMSKLHLDKAVGTLAQRIGTMRYTLSAMASL